MDAAEQIKNRQHAVDSAGYWFRHARISQNKGEMADALFYMENAYNHTESALVALRKKSAIEPTKEVIDYISQYGGRCRDCADDGPVCPGSGLPCGEASKAIKFVLGAYNYGIKNGFLKCSDKNG